MSKSRIQSVVRVTRLQTNGVYTTVARGYILCICCVHAVSAVYPSNGYVQPVSTACTACTACTAKDVADSNPNNCHFEKFYTWHCYPATAMDKASEECGYYLTFFFFILSHKIHNLPLIPIYCPLNKSVTGWINYDSMTLSVSGCIT